MSDYLPEDIMVRIFERLPTKSLIRFSCLSKRWKLLILSDPVFAKSHFQIASQEEALTRRLLFAADGDSHAELECVELEAAGANNESCWVRKKAHTPFINGRDEIVRYCSCNGLVCVLVLCLSLKTRLYIWNPSTGCNIDFPSPNEDHTRVQNCFGFGYVSSTDDYKVFVSDKFHEDQGMREVFYILSLRAASIWKEIEAPNPFRVYRDGTLVHEALHWINVQEDIIAFDLYKEEFRTMPLPPIDINVTTVTTLGASMGGCLYLMNSCRRGYSAEFWIMREYDVADSWTRQLITLSNVISTRLVLATETTLFVEAWGPYKLMRISGDDDNKVEICRVINELRPFRAIEYQETLLWLH